MNPVWILEHIMSSLQRHREFHFTKRIMSMYSSIRKYVQRENWSFVVAPGSCNAIYSSCSVIPVVVAPSCLSFITLHKLSSRTVRRGGVRNVNKKMKWSRIRIEIHPFSSPDFSFGSVRQLPECAGFCAFCGPQLLFVSPLQWNNRKCNYSYIG